jgi:hypothetical protein
MQSNEKISFLLRNFYILKILLLSEETHSLIEFFFGSNFLITFINIKITLTLTEKSNPSQAINFWWFYCSVSERVIIWLESNIIWKPKQWLLFICFHCFRYHLRHFSTFFSQNHILKRGPFPSWLHDHSYVWSIGS